MCNFRSAISSPKHNYDKKNIFFISHHLSDKVKKKKLCNLTITTITEKEIFQSTSLVFSQVLEKLKVSHFPRKYPIIRSEATYHYCLNSFIYQWF